MIRFLGVAAFATVLFAPAYVLAKPNPLSVDVRQAIFVKDVAVTWSADDAKAGDQPDYVAFKQDFQTRVKDTVGQAFLNSPAGQEPVALKIDVKKFSCSYTGCFAEADVSVVQLSDSKELGVYPKVRGVQMSNGGLLGVMVQAAVKPDVVGIATANFAGTLRAKFDAKK